MDVIPNPKPSALLPISLFEPWFSCFRPKIRIETTTDIKRIDTSKSQFALVKIPRRF